MKKIFVKYNPYTLETELTVDGKKLAQNSQIGEKLPDARLQEWVEDLPGILIDEYNDNNFEITFHGTLLDFADLKETFDKACSNGELRAKLERIPAKETVDKEKLIDEVFAKIQNGPFEELKTAEIINSFQQAKGKDFEVCVVATMSAGKSTLINAMLGTKLMPSKQEACTAIITRIKDVDCDEKWQAKVYDKDDRLIETHETLTYETMVRLNEDSNVSLIKATGNIPFVSSEDVSLVMIDTPGPNNSRNPEHKRIQSEFLSKSSKALVLYIMESTFGSDDDNILLHRVSDSMKVGGKQSKDRFIFVLNKMDDRKAEDGKILQTLDKVRYYLKEHGIAEPNLFPAAALPALNIRLKKEGTLVNEDDLDELGPKVRKLNNNEDLHLESYATLPASTNREIEMQLDAAKAEQDEESEALIHTGVVSVEAAIRQYVQKYAKTAKIKNIVDTFIHKLDEVGCFEATKQELAKNREVADQISEQLKKISQKVEDIKTAKMFEKALDEALISARHEAENIVDSIIQKYQATIRSKIDNLRGKKLDMDNVKVEVRSLERFAAKLEPDFQEKLDELIRGNLLKISNDLLQEYKKKTVALTNEITPIAGIAIDPLKLINASLPAIDGSFISKITESERVEDGREWVKNTDKKWYKPWTWLQEDGYYKTRYKTVKYVPAKDLAQEFFAPIEESIVKNGNNAREYAEKQANQIADSFNKEFARLDTVLKQKLAELESYAADGEKAKKRVEETQVKLDWIEDIKEQMASILEI